MPEILLSDSKSSVSVPSTGRVVSQHHKAQDGALLFKISWKLSSFSLFQVNHVELNLSTSEGARAQLTLLRFEIIVLESNFKPSTENVFFLARTSKQNTIPPTPSKKIWFLSEIKRAFCRKEKRHTEIVAYFALISQNICVNGTMLQNKAELCRQARLTLRKELIGEKAPETAFCWIICKQ